MSSVMSLLRIWMTFMFLLSLLSAGNAQLDDRPPPRYNSDQLPRTKFTCEGKFTGRYYADPETDCQMFHICAKTSRRDYRDFKFLCPNGTVFDQEHQVCADYYQVVCHFDSDTNPLGPIFEIYKLSSKESESRREFGSVPPRRDPEYSGQNSLSNEDFQVEEYNNNRLASSRNALPFQSTQIKPLRDDNILFKSTTTPQPAPIPSTEFIFRTPQRQETSTQRNILRNSPILFKLSTLPPQSTTAVPVNFSRRIVQVTQPPPSSQFEILYDRFNTNERPEATPVITPSTPTPTTTTYRPTTTTERQRATASIFDDPQLRFKDFASLNKFQAKFHASFTNQPTTSQTPITSTTTEQFSSSTFSPVLEYTEFANFGFPQQYDTTTLGPATARRFPNVGGLSRNSFFGPKSSDEGNIFSTTQESFPEKTSTVNLDFNTRPRSETNPPTDSQSTRRIPIYDQTFRTTYQEVTTSGPQTFKQQPTRFNDEFFRKIDKPIEFLTTDDEDDFFANAVPTDPNLVGRTSVTETGTRSNTTVRPFRRRRPNKDIGRKNDSFDDSRFNFARRGSKTRFENTSSVTVVEKSVNGEIFNVEASINSGSAGINNFHNNKVAGEAPGRVIGDDSLSSTTPNPRKRGFFISRRVRPSKEGRAHDEQGAEGDKPLISPFGRNYRRGRPTSSSTTEPTVNLTPTTYRPVHKIPILTTSTTVEPELITASDVDIARLRSKFQVSSSTTKSIVDPQPKILSLKVTSKSTYKAVLPPAPKPTRKSEDESIGRTRSPDYDYSYYDTDHEDRGVDSIITDSFGEKNSNTFTHF